jgi:chromate transporter
MNETMGETAVSRNAYGHSVSFREALRVWLRVAALSFGGPAGQIAVMHRILVEEKKWISESRFLHALNYCMLLPGPEAQQLATYIGWLLHRTAGGLVAGTLFVLPGFVSILVLSILYAGFQELTLVQAIFYGIKAAVLAVVVEAVLRIGKRALKNAYMYALAAAAFVAIFFLDVPFPLIIIGAGLIGFLGSRFNPDKFVVIKGHEPKADDKGAALDAMLADGRPEHTRPTAARAAKVAAIWLSLWFVPLIVLAATLGFADVFTQIGLFFSKLAVVTFGGAYAVLAYMAQEAVQNYGWLAPGEMLDGLGMAETTPGPLIQVVQFVAFMGAVRDPGALDPFTAGVLALGARDLGDVRTVLPVDLPRRPVRGTAPQQYILERRLIGDHRGGGRRGVEPRRLVRAARRVRGSQRSARLWPQAADPGDRDHRYRERAARGRRLCRDAALPHRYDSGDRRERRIGRCLLPDVVIRASGTVSSNMSGGSSPHRWRRP